MPTQQLFSRLCITSLQHRKPPCSLFPKIGGRRRILHLQCGQRFYSFFAIAYPDHPNNYEIFTDNKYNTKNHALCRVNALRQDIQRRNLSNANKQSNDISEFERIRQKPPDLPTSTSYHEMEAMEANLLPKKRKKKRLRKETPPSSQKVPSLEEYRTLIYGWLSLQNHLFLRHPKGDEKPLRSPLLRAHNLLIHMHQTSLDIPASLYYLVMIHHHHSLSHALHLLRLMMRSGHTPDREAYLFLLELLQTQKSQLGVKNKKIPKVEARIYEVLRKMYRVYALQSSKEDGTLSSPILSLDFKNVDLLLQSWSCHSIQEEGDLRDAPEMIALIFREFVEIPSVKQNNCLLKAWSNAKMRQDRFEHAERLLLSMEVSSHEKPDCESYTAVLDSFSGSRHARLPLRSEQILNRMLHAHTDDPLRVTSPLDHHLNVVLKAYSSFLTAEGTNDNDDTNVKDAIYYLKRAQAMLFEWDHIWFLGKIDFRPGFESYAIVSNGWLDLATTKLPMNDDEASSLLRKILKRCEQILDAMGQKRLKMGRFRDDLKMLMGRIADVWEQSEFPEGGEHAALLRKKVEKLQ